MENLINTLIDEYILSNSQADQLKQFADCMNSGLPEEELEHIFRSVIEQLL